VNYFPLDCVSILEIFSFPKNTFNEKPYPPLFPILSSVLTVLLLLVTVSDTLHAQSDINGVYFRFNQDPSSVVEEISYKQLMGEIDSITAGNYHLGVLFDGAQRVSLSWMRWLSVEDTTHYTPLINVLEGSGLFDAVFTMDEEPIVNGVETYPSPVKTMADPAECSNLVLPNDPGLFIGDFMHNIQMPCAWSITTGSPDITVGVVDWFFDPNNIEVQGKVLNDPMSPPSVNANGQYGPLGITLWGTDNVTVTKSTFQNIGRESILTIDGSYVAENGNTFINSNERENHRHLSTMATYPYGSFTQIGSDDGSLLPNEFYTNDANDVFIFSEGADARNGLQIIDNEFHFTGPPSDRTGAPAGIEIIGTHVYTITDNLFNSCRRPVVLDNTGQDGFSRANTITCNFFNNSNGPLRFENNNVGTQILQNNFVGAPGFGQIVSTIRWNGESDFEQGTLNNPANNSFESSEPQLEFFVSSTATHFFYNYTDDGSGAPNPFEPRGPANGYTKALTTQGSSNLCGQGLPPGIQGPNSPTEIETVRGILVQLEQYLATNPTDTVKLIEHQEVAKELDQRINQYVNGTVARGEINAAITVLNTLNTAAAEMRIYGVLMTSGRYTEARQKLPAISTYGSKYDEFVYVQNINIDRLTDTTGYTLSTIDKERLTKFAGGDGKSHGFSNSQFRGYSRALLLLLEDERFYDSWGDAQGLPSNTSKHLSIDTKGPVVDGLVEVFPNPTSGMLQIKGEKLAGVKLIDIVNPMGRVLSTISVEGRKILEVNIEQTPGVYLLIFRGENDAFSRKFVVK
jgi:hypothetical protein